MKKLQRFAKGLSVIEMMIALALSSVVTLGVVQLFVANSEGYSQMQGQSRVQESARFALNFIGRSVRKAGYRGCFSDAEAIHTMMLNDILPYEFDVRTGIQGFEGQGTGWNPTFASVQMPISRGAIDTNVWDPNELRVLGAAYDGSGRGIDDREIIHGSDVITFKNMSVVDRRLTAPMVTSTENITIASTVAPDALGFDRDHMAMIHDCEKATVFRITEMTPSGGITTIQHLTDDTDGWGNTTALLAELNTFGADSAVSAIETVTYFLAPSAGFNQQGNQTISLWRKSGIEAPIELVEGVENMQIVYGFDTDFDGVPNQYIDAPLVTNWTQVETIRVTLIVASVDDVGGTTNVNMPYACGATLNTAGDTQFCYAGETTDGQLRRQFTQTFQLRNRG